MNFYDYVCAKFPPMTEQERRNWIEKHQMESDHEHDMEIAERKFGEKRKELRDLLFDARDLLKEHRGYIGWKFLVVNKEYCKNTINAPTEDDLIKELDEVVDKIEKALGWEN